MESLIKKLREKAERTKIPFRKMDFIPLIGGWLRQKRVEKATDDLYARNAPEVARELDGSSSFIISSDKCRMVSRNMPEWFKTYHFVSSALTYIPIMVTALRMCNNYGGN